MDPNIVEDVFGKRISDRFVAIQVTLANKNSNFQFLIHDVSLDLKNVFGEEFLQNLEARSREHCKACSDSCMSRTSPGIKESDDDQGARLNQCKKSCGECGDAHLTFELSSLELSLIRGVAEKGQAQDKRNKLLRYLEGAGTVAAGFVGFVGPKYSDFVALYNGEFLAGYRHVYPDFTINQMNRLSDSAYKSNTLIPKEQARVIVAFIPQAMFLTPEQRKKFRKDPTSLYPDYYSTSASTEKTVDFRRAQALIDGNFVAELRNLPVILTGVQINPDQALEWQKPSPIVRGYILGQFLEGANIALVNPPAGVQIAPDTEATPEEGKLFFVITANGPVPDTTPLSYKVFNTQNTQTISQAVSYTIPTPTLDSQADLEGIVGGPDVSFKLTGKNIIAATKLTIAPADSGVTASFQVETADDGTTSLVGKLKMTNAKEGTYSLGVKNGSLSATVTVPLNVKPKPTTP
ncbi:MAG TPA: hypothetical protein VGO68_02335 [Pyrinomonadaceae bacterium]|jgi:hypothetical protein|nr:hypothetical protein [Pyrinomonadaceae bacterium]